MSFVETFENLSNNINPNLVKFTNLLAPCDDCELEEIIETSKKTTRQHFGNTMRLFAP